MGTSGRGCSFLQDGTNTVISVWPRSRNQFTARRIPRQEKTSLFPWLGRRGGQGQPAVALACTGGRQAALQPLSWLVEPLGLAPRPLAGAPAPVFTAVSHTGCDDQTWGFFSPRFLSQQTARRRPGIWQHLLPMWGRVRPLTTHLGVGERRWDHRDPDVHRRTESPPLPCRLAGLWVGAGEEKPGCSGLKLD